MIINKKNLEETLKNLSLGTNNKSILDILGYVAIENKEGTTTLTTNSLDFAIKTQIDSFFTKKEGYP